MLTDCLTRFRSKSIQNQNHQQQQVEYQHQDVISEKCSSKDPSQKIQSQIIKRWAIGTAIFVILIGLAIGLSVYFFKKPSIEKISQKSIVIGRGNQTVIVQNFQFYKRNIFDKNIKMNYRVWKMNNSQIQCVMGNSSYVYFKKCNNKPHVQYLIDLKKAIEIQVQKLYGTSQKKRFLQSIENYKGKTMIEDVEIQDIKNILIQNNTQSSIETVGIDQSSYNSNQQTYLTKPSINSNRLLLFGWLFRPKIIYQQIQTTYVNTNINVKTLPTTVLTTIKSRVLQNDENKQFYQISDNCFSEQSTDELICINNNKPDSILITDPIMI